MHRPHTYMHNGGIKYDFPFNSILKVPRILLKPSAKLEVFNTSLGTLRIHAGSLRDALVTLLLNSFSAPSWVLNHNQRPGIYYLCSKRLKTGSTYSTLPFINIRKVPRKCLNRGRISRFSTLPETPCEC